MDRDFFKSIKIMDGGMGQLLLEKGMISKGTLWSAGALVDEKYHDLLIDCHLSYINSGADVIVTNTFSCRKFRLKENNIEDKFKFLNKKACELAIHAKQISKKNVLIAGSLPSQRDTYVSDLRSDSEIKNDMHLFIPVWYYVIRIYLHINIYFLKIDATREHINCVTVYVEH